nr:MBOAT family protein [Clostridia bacterium]
YYLSSYALLFVVAIFGATPIAKNAILKLKENKTICTVIDCVEPVVDVVLLTLITACLVNGSFNPFLYFRF